ncbi:NADPH oxidase 4-like isoform X1 [Leptidea sinapis]|uniref:NADPH oxidase 4-like isoform X1 n=2 Tax=Leptidea sinapis TaxID=189913 RepID=UPI002144EA61|nr:NADPH oxidase 4-like isoform X1 [Leptidea sinapis]
MLRLQSGWEVLKQQFFLISWISIVTYHFYNSFIYYKDERKYFYVRRMLGISFCVSRATAAVLNLCCALILLPFCKKINQMLHKPLSKLWPRLFFFWLENAKCFHMTVSVTLLLSGVTHSISHFINLWNFSRHYDEQWTEINLARYKNENPVCLLMTVAGMSGLFMLLIVLCMGVTSLRIVRRRVYNVFWYTHQLYLLFLVLLIIHPLSGVLKEEVVDQLSISSSQESLNETVYYNVPRFTPIKSKTWLWVSLPLTYYFIDLVWRIFVRNQKNVQIIWVRHMPGRTISLNLRIGEQFSWRVGQYVLLQCCDISSIEWHPFTVVKIPDNDGELEVWIKVKGDWTEALEKLLLEQGHHDLYMLVDGPFSSPMEGISQQEIAICVAAGVGITPFVALLRHLYRYPRSQFPGRIHLIWIVRNQNEISWLADLANKTMLELRNANKPDRLHLELYVTSNKHIICVNEKGVPFIAKNNNDLTLFKSKNRRSFINKKANIFKSNYIKEKLFVKINTNKDLRELNGRFFLNKDNSGHLKISEEEMALLTPNLKRNVLDDCEARSNVVRNIDVLKNYPLVGCRIRRGRPHWDRVFGYWVHLYPGYHINLYCCGPKTLVRLLREKCKNISSSTKTKITFIHESFS